jgi:dipeptidyl aminopeptidase/acylaminoacyl peptidase
MTMPDEGTKLGSAPPPKPEGAEWAKPLEVIDKVTYRTDDGGYLKPGFDHIFVVDALGGAPRQLTFGAYHDGAPEWAPDGRSILFSAVRKPDWEMISNDSEIYRLDIDSGTVRPLTDRRGPDSGPKVSPDGRLIAYVGFDDHKKGFEQADLYVMNPTAAEPAGCSRPRRRSTRSNGPRTADHWSCPMRSRIGGRVAHRPGRASHADRQDVGGRTRSPYAGGVQRPARSLAYTSDSVNRPSDVSVVTGGARQLTRLNDLALSGKSLGTLRPLDVAAPDGSRVPSWILLPPGYQEGTRVPTILEIHGGPYAAYGPHFSTDYQLYAAAGYAVLYTNPRGSTGYGQAFADGIEKTYPDSNTADLLAAVDAAMASGVSDPENLFVTGGSGGGILTAWLVGKTDRFKAAASQKPVINWTSMALTSDGIQFFGPYWMGALPWENYQSYWARSPLSLMANVKTPTLVVVGAEDYRTPVSEAEQLYSALKLKAFRLLVKVPNASHGGIAGRPSQSAAKAAAIIAWFDKYRNAQALRRRNALGIIRSLDWWRSARPRSAPIPLRRTDTCVTLP